MVDNSRFAMGYQSDNIYPPGMYAGYGGFSDGVEGNNQTPGGQFFPSIDSGIGPMYTT